MADFSIAASITGLTIATERPMQVQNPDYADHAQGVRY